MKLYLKNNKGFTLIELLVVIAIIGLLSSVVLASLSSARVKGRDARRMEDLHQIQLALNLYYSDNGHYPRTDDIGWWLYSCNGSWTTLQTFLAPYIKTLSTDPINTSCAGPWNVGYYTYVYGSYGGDKYDLTAAMEQPASKYSCGVKKYKYHDFGAEGVWCSGGYGYWDQLYADH